MTMQGDSRFWDRIAEKYAQRPVADEAAYQKKLVKTQEYLTVESDVLEFGCGTGTTALIHAPFARHILATDISAEMLDIAKTKAAAQDAANVEFEVSDIHSFEAAGRQFDMVMMHSLVHLLQDRAAVVAAAFDLLKPGGVFVSSTACLSGKTWMKPVIFMGRMIGRLPYVAFFSRDYLVDLLRSAGFEIEHEWLPEGGQSVFIIARKPEN
jgi:2-polyprenyl-3-methyl-5-hydroxy-6-metoxy-1,4-benzoquinol methylase